MNLSEFKAWLDGYMLDRANPDPRVIAKKAGEVYADPPVIVPSPYPIHPYPNYPRPYWWDQITYGPNTSAAPHIDRGGWQGGQSNTIGSDMIHTVLAGFPVSIGPLLPIN